MKNTLKSSFSNGKVICLNVDGTGTAKLTGPDRNLATLTDNGTGDYTITLNTAARDNIFVGGLVSRTAATTLVLGAAPTTSAVQVLAYEISAGAFAAVDADFDIVLIADTEVE